MLVYHSGRGNRTMIWSIALIVFITQLVCCIFVKGKYKKYTPTLIVAGIMSVTVLNGTLGVIDAVALVAETKVILMGGLAIGIYHLANWIRGK